MIRPIASRTYNRLALALATAGLAVMATVATGQTPTAPAPATVAAAPVAAAPATTAGDPARGKLKSATCVGCHSVPGFKSAFPSVYSVPMLGGQNAKYIESALAAYKKGERRFPSMIATARSLSDQDVADLAAYFSSQH
jgi:cytochrome c553